MDKLKGGLADKLKDSAFNKKQLSMGAKVELEHTDDPRKAREIARDHLAEHPKYYSELAKMEKRLEKKGAVNTAKVKLLKAIMRENPSASYEDLLELFRERLGSTGPIKITSGHVRRSPPPPRRTRTGTPAFYSGMADEMGKMGSMTHRQLARFRRQLKAIRGKTKSTDAAAKKTVSLKKPTTDRRKLGPFDDHDSHVYDADFLRKSIAEGKKRHSVPSRKGTTGKLNAEMSDAERRYNFLTYGDSGQW